MRRFELPGKTREKGRRVVLPRDFNEISEIVWNGLVLTRNSQSGGDSAERLRRAPNRTYEYRKNPAPVGKY